MKKPSVDKAESHIVGTRVPGVQLHRLKRIKDPRGNLCAGEFLREVPFTPRRFFLVYDVPSGKQRGEHAHKVCHQFLLCLMGAVTIRVTDGRRYQSFRLRRLGRAVHVPPGIWCAQTHYTRDAVLLVLASEYYDAADYIRDFDEYRNLVDGDK